MYDNPISTIQTTGTQGLCEAQVIFGGQPVKPTSIQGKLITAAIYRGQLGVAGDKEIAVKQMEVSKLFPVGIFQFTDK